MDLSGISPASAASNTSAATQSQLGISVLRRVLDFEAAQGAMLAQMVAQSAGLGRNVDVSA